VDKTLRTEQLVKHVHGHVQFAVARAGINQRRRRHGVRLHAWNLNGKTTFPMLADRKMQKTEVECQSAPAPP